MFGQILALGRSDNLKVLVETRTAWVVFYALITLIFELYLRSIEENVFFLSGGGIALAAMLILPKHYLFDFKLLLSLCFVGWLINVVGQNYEFSSVILQSFFIVFQAWLGAFLIYRFSPESRAPLTSKSMRRFLFLGCLIPVVFASSISAFIYWLQGGGIEQWLMWSFSQALSTVLITPTLLFTSHSIKFAHSPLFTRYSWFAWFFICVLILVVFITHSSNNYELLICASLLAPIFLYSALRYGLIFNSFLSLSVGLNFLLFFSSPMSSRFFDSSLEYLSFLLFVFVSQCVLLIVSPAIYEREYAFIYSRKITQVYEAISSVNQTLAGANSSEVNLFKKICKIVTEEVDFISQTCISTNGDVCAFKCLEFPGCTNCNVKNIKGYGRIGRECIAYSEQCGFISHLFDESSLEEGACLCRTLDKETIAGRSYVIYKFEKPLATLTVLSNKSNLLDDGLDDLFKRMANDIGFALDVLAERMRLQIISEAFEHAREAIVITDKNGDIINVNPSFSLITGYSFGDVIGKNPRMLKSGKESKQFYEEMWSSITNEGHWTGEFSNKRKSGDVYVQRGTISSIKDDTGNIKHLIGIMEDVTELKQHEQQVLRLANFDILTGLPNRKMLQTQFEWRISHINEDSQLAVLFIDLDDFKHVNDAFGHQFGDSLLVAVAKRMDDCIKKRSVLSRFGGDEFLLLFEGSDRAVKGFCEELIEVVSRPYYLGRQKVSISCSVGVSLAPRDSSSLDELIGFSDAAMYKSKSIGRSTYSFFAPYMRTQAIEKVELKHELEDAVEANQFVLFYQPKVNVDTDEVVGFEALIRWQHPTKGLLSPGDFISLAEQSGQIISIDYWVLEAVIYQLSEWRKSRFALLPVSINLSLSVFKDLKFINSLKTILGKYDVPANLIDIELTERVAMVDFNYTMLTLESLRALGVNVSIDDFGTGYSSLAYLRDFPIDTLKIDRAFIIDVNSDKHNQGIVSAILAIARTMGMNVVAEGVENDEELSYLRLGKCDFYQGYLYSKPVSVAQVESIFLEHITN